jgi:RNA polymerase sigma-70 factor (ECF subfamily)
VFTASPAEHHGRLHTSSIEKEPGMGRHAADRTAPGSGPGIRGSSAGRRLPRHADLFAPTPGTAAPHHAAEAFEQMVEPHLPALRAYVLRNTGSDEAAAGPILEETLFRAAHEPGRFPRRALAVRPWLMLTARNVLRDGQRHAPAGHDDRPSAPANLARPSRTPGPADPPPATTIVAAMRELTPESRDLIMQTFYGGASLEDLAADRRVPVAKIKSDLFFAMRAVRAVLDQQVADRHGVR